MAIHFILIAGHQKDVQSYCQAVTFSGYIPIVTDSLDLLSEIQNPDTKTIPLLSHTDLLILPGGGDIAPDLAIKSQSDCSIYFPTGRTNPILHDVDQDLDHVQLAYFQYFYKQKKPIIGVCKGMQLINVALSGTLLDDMPPDRRLLHSSLSGYDASHSCNYDFPNSLPELYKIFRDCAPDFINSAHHQCIKHLAPGLVAFQHASDGTIEGFMHESLPILGLQWHPERKLSAQGNCLRIYLYRMIREMC